MLVQALHATYDQYHCPVPGLAYDVVPVSEVLTMTKPSVSLIAIILGIFGLPDHGLRRDPSQSTDPLYTAWQQNKFQIPQELLIRKSQPPQRQQQGLTTIGKRGPPPPPPPPGSSGGPRSPHAPGWGGQSIGGSSSSSRGSSWASGSFSHAHRGHTHCVQTVNLFYDLPGIETPPTALVPISRDTIVRRELASTSPQHHSGTMSLILEADYYYRGEMASVFRGQLSAEGQPPWHVIIKCYPADNFKCLIQELDAYTALAHLACVVPQCWGVVAPPGLQWAGIVLEYAGLQLPSHSGKFIGLTSNDKLLLYSALREIHAAAVAHGDAAPRNVVRRVRGPLCWIDFEKASLNHICPGATCPELSGLRRELGLEVGHGDTVGFAVSGPDTRVAAV
ncbi:hypothetical protein R3P38DRAFT_343699 [Favolaschia claudopus]|uniref:Protein kinase domain-containing protein n=1 Tax=Favolaschia claudopus TaxID=2862362 RepID=A0AAV9ZJT1_9AGAR